MEPENAVEPVEIGRERTPTQELTLVEEKSKKSMNGHLNKLLFGLLLLAIVGLTGVALDSRTRIAVIEGNRYTDEDARVGKAETERRFETRMNAFEVRFQHFSPQGLEKKVDNIESLVREIRAWQIQHAETHAGKK